MNRVVIVFLKYPEPGEVKTRLARDLGDSEAARVYRWLAGETMRAVMESGDEPGVSVRVLFDPPEREADVVSWVSGMVGGERAGRVQYRAQDTAGDLGGRLRRAFEEAFVDGYQEVIAVGTDCADVTTAVMEGAWERLDECDVVFGPAMDGGYYLVGMRELNAGLFSGIPWSTSGTLEASVAAAKSAGLRVALLEELRDIDEMSDWEALRRERGM